MRYVLGIEGGAATTTAVITDETGCVLGVGHGGATRVGRETRNPGCETKDAGEAARIRRALTDATQGAIRMADLENARITATCLGFSHTHSRSDLLLNEMPRYDLLQAACESVLPPSRMIFETGSRMALYAVTFGRPGVVVCAGTGAIAYGLNARGEQAQCGGWGTLLGNEGSGYWITCRALNACCRAHDGVEPPTQLEALLLKHLEMTDLQQLQRAVLSETLHTSDITVMAEIVSRAAAQGDKTARRILREAGKELALSAQAVLRKLNMEQEPVVVGTVGGVFRAGRAVLRTFREMVKQAAPNATIVPARVSLAVGAALIALEASDVPLRDELFLNLENHLPRPATVKA